MMLSIIAAVSNNQVIGRNNQLIWHMPADLRHFKKLTMGHSMIMGRSTYESIGKALPGRRTLVLSRRPEFRPADCEVVNTLDRALELTRGEDQVFITGGADIYQQTINHPLCRRIYLTRIYASFEGDRFFPDIDQRIWELADRQDYPADEKNSYPYSFLLYHRRNVT